MTRGDFVYKNGPPKIFFDILPETLKKEVSGSMVSISEKYLLNINEAVEYFGIGEKKLRQLISWNRELVVMNGAKALINRKKMEKFLDDTESI